MSLFDEAEKDAEKMVGQSKEDAAVANVTQDGEKFLDQETGNKFDSQIQSGGTALDQQADNELKNL